MKQPLDLRRTHLEGASQGGVRLERHGPTIARQRACQERPLALPYRQSQIGSPYAHCHRYPVEDPACPDLHLTFNKGRYAVPPLYENTSWLFWNLPGKYIQIPLSVTLSACPERSAGSRRVSFPQNKIPHCVRNDKLPYYPAKSQRPYILAHIVSGSCLVNAGNCHLVIGKLLTNS